MSRASASAARRVYQALRRQFAGQVDSRGYVARPEDNLVPCVRLDQFEADLRRGDGDELRMKFCAVHSSAALVVNTFAPFRDRPYDLEILDMRGATRVEFERKAPIFPRGKAPNLDVWIEFANGVIAIESKLSEYLTPTPLRFSATYDKLASFPCDPGWWTAFTEARNDAKARRRSCLDRGQLVKHYLGVRTGHGTQQQEGGQAPVPIALLYLFWEPLNWQDVPECRQHRQEVEAFARTVADGSIAFRWMTYSDLWSEWLGVPALRDHARNLKARYEVSV